MPVTEVLRAFPHLIDANAAEHPPGSDWRDLATRRRELTRAVFGSAEPTSAPNRKPPYAPPSWWLDPRHQVVAFDPRPEFDVLTAWARDSSPHAPMIRLVVGPGGAGKTRLGLHLAARLQGEGWIAGILSPAEIAEIGPLAAKINDAVDQGHRVLLVLDYVEGYHAEIEKLAGEGPPDAVRILLLARFAGPWWRRFSPERGARYRVDRTPVTLGPVADPDASFTKALTAFRRRLRNEKDRPAKPEEGKRDDLIPPELIARASRHADMLNLHALALVSALHEHATGNLPAGAVPWEDPLDELVRHESRHLERSGRRLGLDRGTRLILQPDVVAYGGSSRLR